MELNNVMEHFYEKFGGSLKKILLHIPNAILNTIDIQHTNSYLSDYTNSSSE